MERRICSASWCARYRNGGDMLNDNEVFAARSQALNEGRAYLLKILFEGNPDVIVEEAFRDAEDALAVAERLSRYHTNVKAVVVCRMHAICLDDGYKQYGWLTGVETYYKPE